MGPAVGPADEPVVPLSAFTALPSSGGILLELPEIISKAAAWRDLPVPPAQESSPPDDISGVFSRVQRVTRSGHAAWPLGSTRRGRRCNLGHWLRCLHTFPS